jgi:hypothetical protein
VLGEAADVRFAPDLRSIDVDVEDAARSFDQRRRNRKLLPDRIRQTGGRGKVVSLRAVFDGDFHYERFLHLRMENAEDRMNQLAASARTQSFRSSSFSLRRS